MNNSKKDSVKEAFEKAGIKESLHFTKLGYYKLYGENRFLLSFVLQLVSFLCFILMTVILGTAVIDSTSENTHLIFLYLCLFSLTNGLSDLVIGDLLGALKTLGVGALLSYIYLFYT